MPKARTTIELSSDEKSYLENILKKPTIEVRVYKRAKALLMKAEGFSYEDIEEKLDLTRPSIRLCIDKYLEGGLNNALDDKSGRGVLKLLSKLHDDGKTIVLVTHIKDIAKIADRVITLKDSSVISDSKNENKISIDEVFW